MKQGRNVTELYQELHRQANAKRDFLAPAHHIRTRSNGSTALTMEAVGSEFTVNEIAHGQLAEYAGVPKQFYDRLRENASELRVSLRDETAQEADNPDVGDTPLFDVVVNRLLQSKG